MQAHQEPSAEPQRSARERYRLVLAISSLLFALALLSSLLWPAAPTPPGPPTAQPPAGEPPATQPGTQPPTAQPSPGEPAEQPPGPKPAPVLPDPPGDLAALIVNGDRSCAQIALTYDAGSGADGAAAILDVLKQEGVTATFFLTGRWVERYTDLAKRIAAEGHLIANHTYSHPDLTTLKPEEVLAEVRKGEETIRTITGRETRPFFREPYGAFNDQERRLVREAGFAYSIYWEIDTLDWQFPSLQTLTARLTERPKNGSVVLMHLNVPVTAEASAQAIPVLRERGFRFVTVDQLLQCPQKAMDISRRRE